MALRAVLNRSKPWAFSWTHRQFAKGESGFLGSISSNNSVAGHNFLFNSRRHYYLPPPPPREIIFDAQRSYGAIVSGNLETALPSAQFAVTTHNETEGRNIRFARLVRASWRSACGRTYYLTLEGIDENGDLNVYYAVVYNPLNRRPKQLRNWRLVDESFSYQYREIHRISIPCQRIGNPDLLKEIRNFEENVRDISNSCSLPSNEDVDPLASTDFGPVYNILDYVKVLRYALSAVKMQNEKGEKICLADVLYASTVEVDGKVFYIMLLEAMDEINDFNFFYALLEVTPSKTKLIKWHAVDELLGGSRKEDQVNGLESVLLNGFVDLM